MPGLWDTARIADLVRSITGQSITARHRLDGGTAGDDVYRADLSDGRRIVLKLGADDGSHNLEARMLTYLKATEVVPVPDVIDHRPGALVLEYIDGEGGLSATGEAEAAETIARLHSIPADQFGFEEDTVIGGLPQPNPLETDWRRFFAEHRLRYMADCAVRESRLDRRTMDRIERLASRLDRWIPGTGAPSLLHGDLWGGNILCRDGRLAGLIDPAIYFGDAEIDLAFGTLFGTLGPGFFDAYQQHRPLEPGFFEERRDLYNLYPLLVHVRLFGGSYVNRVQRTLDQFGV